MIELSAHNVTKVLAQESHQGGSRWITVKGLDRKGDQLFELTMFAESGRPIEVKFGDEDDE